MAKTVFGVPGIGDKSRETTGDAVAPGGTPGAQSRVELPQKGGKETGPKLPQPKSPASPEPAQWASRSPVDFPLLRSTRT